MTTFRTLEAFVAVVDLGSFQGAARTMNTSQSAVSRLIQEFESGFAYPLFDRSLRSARLTLEGQEVLRLARTVLKQRAVLAESFADPSLISQTLRCGVTELVATTWLPVFVGALREAFPRVGIELEVDASLALLGKVLDGKLDIAIVIDFPKRPDAVKIAVGQARFGWYAASSLPIEETPALRDFERQTLLIQGPSTGAGKRLAQWFGEKSIRPGSVIHSDNLMALLGMAAAGIGLANLPRVQAQEAVASGSLKEVRLDEPPPDLRYVAVARAGALSAFHRSVIDIAQRKCDFSAPFHSSGARQANQEPAAC